MTSERASLFDASRLSEPRAVAITLVALLSLLGFVYRHIIVHLVRTWGEVPDYSHGYIVAPLAIYFAMEKRYALRRAEIEGSWWGVALLAAGVASLALGELGGLLTALRSGLIFTLMGLVLLLAGREVFRILLFPMAFLFLMVPLPQSLVNVVAFPLQLVAASWAVAAMRLLGIPTLLEGNIIHLANTELFVAEACSGLRSLMALLTLGVVFAQFFRPRQPVQKLVLIASTVPIAIFVNALRVALTGVLTHSFGRDAAGGVIHDFQGVITFTMAFFLLFLLARVMELVFGEPDSPGEGAYA